ncbi:MAG: 50S ribosomal protein L10 [Bacillota bacterium]
MESKQRLEKAKVQASLKNKMTEAKSVVFVGFKGLSVLDDTRLRRMCREAGVEYKVIKNTIARRAVDELGWQGLDDVFQGTTAMAASSEDPVAPARVINTFAREVPALTLKGGVLEGEFMDANRVAYLATLPSRQELLARVAGGLKSPIAGMVSVLGATLSGFARAVDALRAKRAEAGA